MRAEPLSVPAAGGGEIQAALAVPAGPVAAAVIAHPHPDYGGDMDSPVVTTIFDRLVATRVAALRFNFRTSGDGARLDLEAALAALAGAVPDVPLVVAGYSFGADVAASVDGDRVAGWVLVAPPLHFLGDAEPAARRDDRPVLVLAAEHDQFNPAPAAAAAFATWPATTVEVVPGADHFLAGATGRVADRAAEFVTALVSR